MKIIKAAHGDYTLADASEVFVEWQPAVMANLNTTRSLFLELEQQAKAHPGHESELAALKSRYEWLLQAYYRDDQDKKIRDRCRDQSMGVTAESRGNPAEMAKLAEQVRKLIEEGRFDEVKNLQEKLKAASPKNDGKQAKADNFGLWQGCLAEMAEFAYLTKVTIALDPSLWR